MVSFNPTAGKVVLVMEPAEAKILLKDAERRRRDREARELMTRLTLVLSNAIDMVERGIA